jgi:hypothetical protein
MDKDLGQQDINAFTVTVLKITYFILGIGTSLLFTAIDKKIKDKSH